MKVNIRVDDLELRTMAPHINEDMNKLELEIVRWETDKNCYTVAYWAEGELSFEGDRPFNIDKDTFWMLAKLGQQLFQQNEGE